jgi:hypothetical protein
VIVPKALGTQLWCRRIGWREFGLSVRDCILLTLPSGATSHWRYSSDSALADPSFFFFVTDRDACRGFHKSLFVYRNPLRYQTQPCTTTGVRCCRFRKILASASAANACSLFMIRMRICTNSPVVARPSVSEDNHINIAIPDRRNNRGTLSEMYLPGVMRRWAEIPVYPLGRESSSAHRLTLRHEVISAKTENRTVRSTRHKGSRVPLGGNQWDAV